MKKLLIVICLAALAPGQYAMAAAGFPWFRTRPKPVLLDQTVTPAEQSKTITRVAYHGNAALSSSGRLYFKDSRDSYETVHQKAHIAPSGSNSHGATR
jgi:hypothetical protein